MHVCVSACVWLLTRRWLVLAVWLATWLRVVVLPVLCVTWQSCVLLFCVSKWKPVYLSAYPTVCIHAAECALACACGFRANVLYVMLVNDCRLCVASCGFKPRADRASWGYTRTHIQSDQKAHSQLLVKVYNRRITKWEHCLDKGLSDIFLKLRDWTFHWLHWSKERPKPAVCYMHFFQPSCFYELTVF